MNTSRAIIFALLLSFSFSIFHSFVMAKHESEHRHCDIEHFVKEFSSPDMDHDESDLCSSHYIYHVPYLVTESFKFDFLVSFESNIKSTPKFYPINLPQTFLKPPIS